MGLDLLQIVVSVEKLDMKEISRHFDDGNNHDIYVGGLNETERKKYIYDVQERIVEELSYDTRINLSEDGTYYTIFLWRDLS